MGVRIIWDKEQNHACIYCSVSDWAFGPVFYGDDAGEQAELFLKWLYPTDARTLGDAELERKYGEFLNREPEQEEESEDA